MMIEDSALMHPVDGAAARIGVGRSTFYQLMAEGQIHAVKIGRRTLVPEAELVAYVQRLRLGDGVPAA